MYTKQTTALDTEQVYLWRYHFWKMVFLPGRAFEAASLTSQNRGTTKEIHRGIVRMI